MLQNKRAIRVHACVCACLLARVIARACVRCAREFVCVAAAVWLWGPLVHGGIIIVTTTTTTTPEDDLDYTTTTASTPHAALVGNR